MKATIEFNLDDLEDKIKMKDALNAQSYKTTLYDIAREVFRPARKHGYADRKIQDIIEKNDDSIELVGLLEELFYKVLDDNEVTLD